MEPEFSVPQWGIAIRDALWPVTVRILLVIDGRINLTSNKMEFGLGYVLDTLRAPSSWWISINVHVATREQTITAAELGTNTVQYQNFRFTDGEFNIDNYDQVWFFGDQPSQDDGSDATTDLHIVPPYTLDDAEAQIVAAWMDRGGGVFATGDHGVLGASLCSRIPRVRTMRRWKRSDGVPSLRGARLLGERTQLAILSPIPATSGDVLPLGPDRSVSRSHARRRACSRRPRRPQPPP
jgi:hypothetical protein